MGGWGGVGVGVGGVKLAAARVTAAFPPTQPASQPPRIKKTWGTPMGGNTNGRHLPSFPRWG